jgi:hypothetical protein
MFLAVAYGIKGENSLFSGGPRDRDEAASYAYAAQSICCNVEAIVKTIDPEIAMDTNSSNPRSHLTYLISLGTSPFATTAAFSLAGNICRDYHELRGPLDPNSHPMQVCFDPTMILLITKLPFLAQPAEILKVRMSSLLDRDCVTYKDDQYPGLSLTHHYYLRAAV